MLAVLVAVVLNLDRGRVVPHDLGVALLGWLGVGGCRGRRGLGDRVVRRDRDGGFLRQSWRGCRERGDDEEFGGQHGRVSSTEAIV